MATTRTRHPVYASASLPMPPSHPGRFVATAYVSPTDLRRPVWHHPFHTSSRPRRQTSAVSARPGRFFPGTTCGCTSRLMWFGSMWINERCPESTDGHRTDPPVPYSPRIVRTPRLPSVSFGSFSTFTRLTVRPPPSFIQGSLTIDRSVRGAKFAPSEDGSHGLVRTGRRGESWSLTVRDGFIGVLATVPPWFRCPSVDSRLSLLGIWFAVPDRRDPRSPGSFGLLCAFLSTTQVNHDSDPSVNHC